MSNAIVVERRERSSIIRFMRPGNRNPLSIDVVNGLMAILDNVRRDPEIERLIFTGSDGVFASGADLREIAEISAGAAPEFARRGQALMAAISALPQRSVAAINGLCFGGALDLALACDRRLAVSTAQFCHPGVGLGIITGWGGTQRLPRLIGEAAALEMFLTAGRMLADNALRIGLVDKIVDDPLQEALID